MRARILDRIVASAHIEDSDAMPAGFYELPSLQILELKTCDTETIRLARGTKFKEAGADLGSNLAPVILWGGRSYDS